MKSLLDTINLCSMEWRKLKGEEFENKDWDYEELNESHFRNRTLFVNHKGDDFYHSLEILPTPKYSAWINDVIEESLRSQSAGKLYKALKNVVGNVDFRCEDLNSPCLLKVEIWNLEEYLPKILEICQFYRYYISAVYVNIVFFEPVLTTEVTKDIKNQYGNKVYHLCKKKNSESIKKNGLIISGATGQDIDDPIWYISWEDLEKTLDDIDDNTIRKKIQKHIRYRIFPNRVFVFYTNENLDYAVDVLCDIAGFEKEKYNLVEVSLKGHKIPFFKDTSMRDNDFVKFAYSNIDIPPKLITNTIEL